MKNWPKMTSNVLKIGTLVKQGPTLKSWKRDKVLRVVKRKKTGYGFNISYRYFLVGDGDPSGFGCWVSAEEILKLSPLELLAAQCV